MTIECVGVPRRQKVFQSLFICECLERTSANRSSQYSESKENCVRQRLLQLGSERLMRTDKLFHIGSRSKTFTAVMALMQR